MKIKALICACLCVLLIGMTAFATQSTEENAADNNTQQSEMQPPQEGQMPSDGNMPQDGEFNGRGFGGRGNPGGNRGMRPDMPMNGEPPAGEPQTQPDSSIPSENAENTPAATTTQPNYFTHISAAVLLVLGFLFVIFYKRRTF